MSDVFRTRGFAVGVGNMHVGIKCFGQFAQAACRLQVQSGAVRIDQSLTIGESRFGVAARRAIHVFAAEQADDFRRIVAFFEAGKDGGIFGKQGDMAQELQIAVVGGGNGDDGVDFFRLRPPGDGRHGANKDDAVFADVAVGLFHAVRQGDAMPEIGVAHGFTGNHAVAEGFFHAAVFHQHGRSPGYGGNFIAGGVVEAEVRRSELHKVSRVYFSRKTMRPLERS